MLILWSPNLDQGLLTLRLAVFAIGLGPGLVILGSLVRRRDTGARWLAAFLGWALLCAVFSVSPRLSIIGTYGSDVGWLYLAGYGAAWGLGRRMSPQGVRLLPAVLLAGIGANVAVAILEAIFEPTGMLESSGGRVLGLMSNTLFLAGMLAGGLVLIGYLSGASVRRGLLLAALAMPFTTAINLTGSRAALVGGTALALVAAAVGRRSRGGTGLDLGRAALVVLAAIALGFVLSLPIQSDASGASRVGDVSSASGYGSRLTMWGAGVQATAERPVFGWGPGRFREATSDRVTASFARGETPNRLFYDAHNVAVEQLVTTGIVGLVLFGGFVVTVFRRARGPLAWFAGGVALTWLLNPLSVCTAPVVLVALGAAWSQAPPRPSTASARRTAAARGIGAALALVGLLVGGALIWSAALIQQGSDPTDVATLERAARLRPADPVVQGIIADAAAQQAILVASPANQRAALDAVDELVRREPSRPTWWVRRGYARGTFGPGTPASRARKARADFERAYELDPWSLEALTGLRDVADFLHDDAAVARWNDRICQISDCPAP
ncbi:MAG: O-antigen ligase family protein [Aquihabitans sp.]